MSDPREDQLDAAVRDAEERLKASAAQRGLLFADRPNNDPEDPRMSAWIAGLKATFERERPRQCGHLQSPQPMYLDAWDEPYVLRCQSCQEQKPGLTGDADVTCDLCGQVDRTGIWPVQMGIGPIIITLGRCDACTPDRVKREIRERPR